MKISDELAWLKLNTAKHTIHYFTNDGVVVDGQLWVINNDWGSVTRQRAVIQRSNGRQEVVEFSGGNFSMIRGNDVSLLYVGFENSGNLIAIVNRSSGYFYRYHDFQQYYREFFYRTPKIGFFESSKKYDIACDKACVAFEAHTNAVCQSLFRK